MVMYAAPTRSKSLKDILIGLFVRLKQIITRNIATRSMHVAA